MKYLETIFALSVHAFVCALMACVYVKILAHEPVLNWWFRFGLRFRDSWFHKPIWGCEKCVSGQLALWSYAIFSALPLFGLIPAFYPVFEYNLLLHLYTVSLSVLFALLISRVFTKNEI